MSDNHIANIDRDWETTLTVTIPGGYEGWTLDPTLVLQPDSSTGKDATTQETQPTFNYGTRTEMFCGGGGAGAPNNRQRGLIQFDLSSIPSGSTVDSASLVLDCNVALNASARNIGVHQAITEWFEGDVNGAATTIAGSTWDERDGFNSIAWRGS